MWLKAAMNVVQQNHKRVLKIISLFCIFKNYPVLKHELCRLQCHIQCQHTCEVERCINMLSTVNPPQIFSVVGG